MPLEEGTPAQVTCYSGASYAERPTEIRAFGKQYRIEKITAEGRTPLEKWFQVVTENGQRLRLMYHPAQDRWTVSGLDAE